MVGILYQTSNETPQLVTLTTAPNDKCAEYHKRMPVLVLPQNVDYWFQSSAEQLFPIFEAIDENIIDIAAT